jgi:hypothetical protein
VDHEAPEACVAKRSLLRGCGALEGLARSRQKALSSTKTPPTVTLGGSPIHAVQPAKRILHFAAKEALSRRCDVAAFA